MDAISREFDAHLSSCRTRFAGDPGRELLSLLLIALEREQMVSVSYRERLMADRLRRTGLSEDARDLIRHALLWVWKDEEMHAIYVRGLLLKRGGLRLKIACFLQELSGQIGGWASSVRLHLPWSRAPFLRLAATLLQAAGVVAGKVPREVRRELDVHPFHHFCEFNVDAENTASRCWDRLVEVAASLPDVPREQVDEFRRMKADEDEHCRVFEIIASSLDPDDRLRPGATLDGLAARIGAVGESFLPRSRRAAARQEHALGTGGVVAVRRGGEKAAAFRAALDAAGLPAILARRPRGFRAAVKASFMMGYHRRDRSPHVDPALAETLALYLREHGAGDVLLLEAPNLYDRFFLHRSVKEVARYLGFTSGAYRVADLSEDPSPHRFGRGMGQHSVGRAWKDADVRLVLGKLKSHPVDVFTAALSATEGIGTRSDAFIFTERQVQRAVAIVTALADFPPHFAVVDAWEHVPDGLLGMMEGVHVKAPRRVYAGEDAVAVDLVAGRHLGADPRASSIVREACHWFGDPRITVDGPDEPIRGWRGPFQNDLSALLSAFAYPFYALCTGRGALFVPEMDAKAFPPRTKEGFWLRFARRWIQTLLIMRPMK